MSKVALVTGAEGFVGQRLCAYLAAQGWQVHRAALRGEDGAHRCDITQRAQVDALLAAVPETTHVFHLAALTFVPEANQRPMLAMTINYGGTVNLAQAILDTGRPIRLIAIGSADAYGPPEQLPMTEAHPLRPQNAYAISKAAADQVLGYLAKAQALDVVRMRPFNHSGPGQPDQFVLPSLAKQIAAIAVGQAAPVVKVGNLSAKRDFLHVDDVLRAYALVAEQGEAGAVYNVCSGEPVSIQSALDQLIAIAGVDVQVEPDPARMRPVDVKEVAGSYAALEAATGWRPQVSFAHLLRELFDAACADLRGAQS